MGGQPKLSVVQLTELNKAVNSVMCTSNVIIPACQVTKVELVDSNGSVYTGTDVLLTNSGLNDLTVSFN